MTYERIIFVFGSNLAGRHGAGSAKAAHLQHGAIYGQGRGLQGNSYAIPTKGRNLEVLPLAEIAAEVADFIRFAEANPAWRFDVVKIGCGLANYSPDEIGPLFRGAPANCILPFEFKKALQQHAGAASRTTSGMKL